MKITKSVKLGILIIIIGIMGIETIKSNQASNPILPKTNTIYTSTLLNDTSSANITSTACGTYYNSTALGKTFKNTYIWNNPAGWTNRTTYFPDYTRISSFGGHSYVLNVGYSGGVLGNYYYNSIGAQTSLTMEYWICRTTNGEFDLGVSNANNGALAMNMGISATGYCEYASSDGNNHLTTAWVPLNTWVNLRQRWAEGGSCEMLVNNTSVANFTGYNGNTAAYPMFSMFPGSSGYVDAISISTDVGYYNQSNYVQNQAVNTTVSFNEPSITQNLIINATVFSYATLNVALTYANILVNNSITGVFGLLNTINTTTIITGNTQNYFNSTSGIAFLFQCNTTTAQYTTFQFNYTIQLQILYYMPNPALYNNIELINSGSTAIDFRFNSSDFIVGPGTTFWNLTQGYYNFTMLPATLQGSTYVIGTQLQASVWVYVNGITVQIFGYQPTSYVSCSIGVKNQQNNHIENQIAQYLVNGTSVNPASFTRAVGSINNITLIDNFGNNIATSWFAVNTIDNTNNNYYEFTVNQYTISVYNQQSSFNLINVTQSGSFNLTKYLGPNTQWDFHLFAGTYYVWVNNSETATWIQYTYSLTTNTNLLISSANNTLANILSNIQQNGASITNISLWLNSQMTSNTALISGYITANEVVIQGYITTAQNTIGGYITTAEGVIQGYITVSQAAILAQMGLDNATISWLVANNTGLITSDYNSLFTQAAANNLTISGLIGNQTVLISADYNILYPLLSDLNLTVFQMNNSLFYFNATTQTALLLDIQSLAQMINQTINGFGSGSGNGNDWTWLTNKIKIDSITMIQTKSNHFSVRWNVKTESLLLNNIYSLSNFVNLDNLKGLDMYGSCFLTVLMNNTYAKLDASPIPTTFVYGNQNNAQNNSKLILTGLTDGFIYSNYNTILFQGTIGGHPVWDNVTNGIESLYDPDKVILPVSYPIQLDQSQYDFLYSGCNVMTLFLDVFNESSQGTVASLQHNNFNLLYELEPLLYLNSSQYTWNDLLFYIYTPSQAINLAGTNYPIFAWTEMNPTDFLITNPYYKIKILDKNTRDVVFEDLTFQSFKALRTIDIPALQIQNNANYPIFFGFQSNNYMIPSYSHIILNCSLMNYTIIFYDQDGNVLQNLIVDTSVISNISYSPSPLIQCFISLADSEVNYLPWENYQLFKNNSQIYSNLFFGTAGSHWNITIRDRFGFYLNSTIWTINGGLNPSNFIAITLDNIVGPFLINNKGNATGVIYFRYLSMMINLTLGSNQFAGSNWQYFPNGTEYQVKDQNGSLIQDWSILPTNKTITFGYATYTGIPTPIISGNNWVDLLIFLGIGIVCIVPIVMTVRPNEKKRQNVSQKDKANAAPPMNNNPTGFRH
jgi:hypothetical protein